MFSSTPINQIQHQGVEGWPDISPALHSTVDTHAGMEVASVRWSVRRSTLVRASEGDSTLPDYQTDGPTTDRQSDPGWELELALCWHRHG